MVGDRMPRGGRVTTTEFAATDAEEAEAALAATFSDNHLRLSGNGGAFRYAQTRHDLGPVQLDTLQNTLTVDVVGEPTGSVILCRMLDEVLDLDVGHGSERYGRGDLLLAMHPGRRYRSTMRGASEQVVSVDLTLLREVAGDEVVSRLLRDGPFGSVITPEAALSWQPVVDFAVVTIASWQQRAPAPLVVDGVSRLIAATAVSIALPPTATTAVDRADATPPNLRRAVAFIESNPDLGLGLADIARAARVTPRAVQLGFRRHLGTTPLAYLRRVRLAAAHDALKAADGRSGDTVASIAATWGFANPGRFAAEYRAAYGELPSDTVRR